MSNSDINSLWLGRMQTELGTLQSNVMLLEIRCDQLQQKATEDAALIEALKTRVRTAESARAELASQVRARKPKHV